MRKETIKDIVTGCKLNVREIDRIISFTENIQELEFNFILLKSLGENLIRTRICNPTLHHQTLVISSNERKTNYRLVA